MGIGMVAFVAPDCGGRALAPPARPRASARCRSAVSFRARRASSTTWVSPVSSRERSGTVAAIAAIAAMAARASASCSPGGGAISSRSPQALAAREAPAEIALVAEQCRRRAGARPGARARIPTVALPHGDYPIARRARGRRPRTRCATPASSGSASPATCGCSAPEFVAAYPERILNIHPSLLPAFPGLHPQRQALAAGVRISGCTVHLVDGGLDSGPIVVQRAVPVEDGRRRSDAGGAHPRRGAPGLRRGAAPTAHASAGSSTVGGCASWAERLMAGGRRYHPCRRRSERRSAKIEKKFVEGVDRNRGVSYYPSPAALRKKPARQAREGREARQEARLVVLQQSPRAQRSPGTAAAVGSDEGSEFRSGC